MFSPCKFTASAGCLALLLLILAACGATKAADGDAATAAQDGVAADVALLADIAPDALAPDVLVAPQDIAIVVDVPVVQQDAAKPTDAGCTAAGCVCAKNEQCDSNYCIEGPAGQQCAKLCSENCDVGFKCAQVAGTGSDILNLCVPAFPRLCEPCAADSDCSNVLGGADSRCVPYKDATTATLGNFCATKCATNSDCFTGFSCKELTSVGGVKGGQCVKDDLVCVCDGRATKLQLTTACNSVNSAGTCGGKRSCGVNGLSACDAVTAAPEQCNLKDDDCDGLTDEPSSGMCDDLESCSYDNCIAGECQHPPKPGLCDDKSACTSGDECNNGKCLGKVSVCDDKNPCTIDSCDVLKGCVAAADDGGKCSDDNVCTINDSCGGGLCLAGVATVCDDNNLCTTDSCNPKNGCIFNANSLPCTDNDLCTIADTCKNSVCAANGKLPCSDGNPCTDDSCDGIKGCIFTNNTAICDDNNNCTTGDTCKDGTCTPSAPSPCDDGNPCTTEICDPKTGCKAFNNKAQCSDNNVCTDGDTCKDGACSAGVGKVCDDGNPCTTDLCDVTKGCITFANAEECSDGNVCTDGDNCAGNKCKPGKVKMCNDGNACTDDFCDPVTGCNAQSNSNTCSDGDLCTVIDMCKGGECAGSGAPNCDDGNSCTDDSCDKIKGCVHAPNNGGCSDGNACTLGDLCKNSACTPGQAKECDDSNNCTTDSCDAVNGCGYNNNAAPCTDGNICTEFDSCADGKCKGGKVKLCDDNNVCTDDDCNPLTGCTVKNNAAACEDNNGCTGGDVCNGGKCKGAVGCDVNALCTPGAQSVSCVCNKGYAGTGFLCVDVDECKDGSFKCPANESCANTVGGYTCACSANFGDCNKSITDGCEANLSNDINNCNVCGTICGTANAVAKCNTGVCALTCNAGFGDCDGKNANGCELQINGSDNNNCGGCGVVCGGGKSCSAGACSAGLTKWSEGTAQWPDQACNPNNSFGSCNTNAQNYADAWALYVCKLNGYTKGVWTGNKQAGCNGQVSMYCGNNIPCQPLWEYNCSPSDQTKVEITCN